MKPNPNTLDHLNAVLALLNSPIEPQDTQIAQWLAQHARGQEHKVEPIKEDDDGR